MPRTILIIDDDQELCDLVGELLRGEGFEVDAHHSGEGAIELAAGGRYELVILDVMLPGQNGFEILRGLRRQSAVPVILLTARGEDVDRLHPAWHFRRHLTRRDADTRPHHRARPWAGRSAG